LSRLCLRAATPTPASLTPCQTASTRCAGEALVVGCGDRCGAWLRQLSKSIQSCQAGLGWAVTAVCSMAGSGLVWPNTAASSVLVPGLLV
jgi:hypothetical protein